MLTPHQTSALIFAGCLLGLLLMVQGCKKDETLDPVDLGYRYFPAKIGSWIIYDVDSIFYDGLNLDTIYYHYQVMEKLAETWTDNAGRQSIRIERHHRANPDSAWSVPRIGWAVITPTRLEKTEENLTYIRLVFPVREEVTWNGNATNTADEMTYEYTAVDEPMQIGTFGFDSVARVEQFKSVNLIENRLYEERYAKNVGLVYKRMTDVEIKLLGGTGSQYANGTDVRLEIHSMGGF